ncbi:hypothetical protein GE061_001996 [Apolygus lucorum]|uniref:Cytochrome P450 n=1 Tax=Apolygus lucorum TaxID=248454 RepID=A0A6A4JET7_APOLU|nr:hypothetical protein GE061_001996 [Apolygus lucorum]
MELFTVLVAGFVCTVVLGFLFALKRNQYWADRGIHQYKPLPFFGDMLPVLLRRKTLGEHLMEMCRAHPDEKVIGFYFFMKPSLVINDLELLEKVLIKDFSHFADRGPQPKNVVHMNLFSTTGNLWRAIRNRFSPMFTTGKLRFMFPQISGLGEDFMNLLRTKREKVDMVDYFGKFATEVIGVTAFGLEGRAMEENSEFREKAKKIFEPSFSNYVKFVLGPSLMKLLGVPPTNNEMLYYFGPAVKNAMKYRRENGVVRHDFIQHMVTLQQKGTIEVDKDDVSDEILMMDHVPEMKVEMSDNLMIGQSMGFMVAGFDATALTMGWLCYELAMHPEIQSKARQEVKEVLEKHGNRLDYDTVREMKFLSTCLKENGRLHSALDVNFRMVTKPYKVPDTSAVLERGSFVYIPNLSIHMDPKYYPEPEKFLPDRWIVENTDKSSCKYLPFGTGPRMCIAMRFANMEMMCAIAKLLLNFEVSIHPSTKLPPRIEPYSFFTYPRDKLYFNLKKLNA